MNLIDPIKHQLLLINPDLSSWRITLTAPNNQASGINAHNEMMYRGRSIDFYIKYTINRINFDIEFSRIIFSQNQEYNRHIGNQKTRERLEKELIAKFFLNQKEKITSSAQQELEKAARIILNAIKTIEK